MKPTRQPTTDTINDPMNPAALLRAAVIYLNSHGWTQGTFFLSFDPEPFPPACALGAINVCAHGEPTLSAVRPDDDPNTDAAIAAMRVFAAYLDPDYGIHHLDHEATCAIDVIGDWNDDKARTLGEVVEALTDAARDWETAHPAGGAG